MKTEKTSYSKLGFTKPETEGLVKALNELLANYAVMYQKLRNFHWNVTGGDFFDVHEKLEEEYNTAIESIDSIAERIRVFGEKPISTMAEYLEVSNITEPTEDLSATDMMKTVVEDYQILLSYMVDVADEAIENGDLGTETLMRTMIMKLEQKHWMFSAFIKE